VTARDLARQIPAHWQEAVKNGQTFSFADYTREVLREPGAPDSDLWNEQDLVAVLDRWAPLVAPENVHLVTCPPRGAPSDALWSRFADAVGVPEGAVDPQARRTNQSLGTTQVRLLRDVNLALAGRIGQPAYAHVVKRFLAQRVLAGSVPSRQALAPAELREPLERIAATWTEQIVTRGYRVHGDLGDLAPNEFGGAGSTPDDVTDAELAAIAPVVVAQLMERLAEPAESVEPAPAVQPSRRILRKFRA
jgi:hypothetical protein